MPEYGTPLGTQAPGQTTAKRNVAKPASDADRKAALKAYDARSKGESRRNDAEPPPKRTTRSVFDTVKDKQYSDMEAGDQ